jgi:3-oxoadipate enol-lactonase
MCSPAWLQAESFCSLGGIMRNSDKPGENFPVAANGTNFRCRIDGPGTEDAPWLMFSNSLMTDLSLWDDQVAAFKDRYRILRYDQRGHGGTPVPPADCTFEGLVDDAAALLDALGINGVNVVGVSMGGVTALGLASRYPDRVSTVVISDASAATPEGGAAAWDERIALAAKGGMEALVEPTITRWFRPASLTADTPVVRRVREMIRRTPFEGFKRAARALQSFDFSAALAKLSPPALLTVGAGDGVLPGLMRKMAAEAPGSRFAEIAEAGHLPNIEQPEAFNDALAQFLREASSRSKPSRR